MKLNIAIAYHSGYGHTEKVAKHVAKGVENSGHTAQLIKVAEINEDGWNTLDNADAIIFGSPTYMGGVSGPFKTFLDQTVTKWGARKWRDKIAAGFTNSGNMSGDKLNSLMQMIITAMQHDMIWVSQGIAAPNKLGNEDRIPTDINRMGSYSGLMTQSNNVGADITPPDGDLKTAELFGQRIAEVTIKFKK